MKKELRNETIRQIKEQLIKLRQDKCLSLEAAEKMTYFNAQNILKMERGNKVCGLQLHLLIDYINDLGCKVEIKIIE